MLHTPSRASGLLAHPTSFPGRFGIGDFGEAAYRFVDFLRAAKQALWQVMPLGPTGYGDSPYACYSAFAGNPYLIALEPLVREGLLEAGDLEGGPDFGSGREVNFNAAIPFKLDRLRRAYDRFCAGHGDPKMAAWFTEFRGHHAAWLTTYATFMALKDFHGGPAWVDWAPELSDSRNPAVTEWKAKHSGAIEFHQFCQFQFFRQWGALKSYAARAGVQVIGDIPIFVAFDSADVWANPEQFWLDETGQPTVVAGVPPDYFSPTGQRWGNPLYRWDRMKADGYRWWIDRFRAAFELYDIVRLDHFRGFEAYWAVPADQPTAEHGTWEQGPGIDLFRAVSDELGDLKIIAEDLGLITAEVEQLIKQTGFPGMKVLQFAFSSDATDPFLPHNHQPHTVVYTGTHDNDTTVGWFQSCTPKERSHAQRYLGRDGHDIAWDLIRAALGSVADTAVVPVQDLLQLGTEARMNMPGKLGGNWGWRYHAGDLTPEIAARLADLTTLYWRDGLQLPRKRTLSDTMPR